MSFEITMLKFQDIAGYESQFLAKGKYAKVVANHSFAHYFCLHTHL